MDMEKLRSMKTKAGIAAALVVVAGGSYAVASWMSQPEVVAVSGTGCGNIAATANFGVPLRTVDMAAPAVQVSYGPVEYPSAGGPFRLAFDKQVDGREREVVMVGDTLRLPMTFGRDNASPKQIRITCRDNAITTVRYARGRTATTFNVTRQEVSDSVVEPEVESAS